MEVTINVLYHFASAIPIIITLVATLIFANLIFLRTTPFSIVGDLLEKRNLAVAIVLGGFLFGTVVACSATTYGHTDQDDHLVTVVEAIGEGGLVIGLLRLSVLINDKLILPRFAIYKELLEDSNLGAAFCVAATCIASGLILNGALSGYSSGGYWFGLLDVCIYWFVGQAMLVIASKIYARLSRYDIHHLIEFDDNVAAGLGYGAMLLSLGIILRATLVGAGKDVLVNELVASMILGCLGIVLVTVIDYAIGRWMFPQTDYEQEVEIECNLAVSTVTATVILAVAMVTSTGIRRLETQPVSEPNDVITEVDES